MTPAEAALPLPAERARIVVIGASAGGVEALVRVVCALPEGFDGAVFVVLHMRDDSSSTLAQILDRSGPLPATWAFDGQTIAPGTVSVAPPGLHVVLERERARLVRGPKINGYRPSVDVLFHSAASAHGPAVTGVVLSGALSDGTLGLRAVKRHGGRALVQADALHEGMPTSAIENVDVDAVVPVDDIAGALATTAPRPEDEMSDRETESQLEASFDVRHRSELDGTPSLLRCPECGGAIWELDDDPFVGYACHVGHTYSADSMLAEHNGSVERALWIAVTLLEEKASLVTRLAERTRETGNVRSTERFEARAREALQQAELIRELLRGPEEEQTTVDERVAERPGNDPGAA